MGKTTRFPKTRSGALVAFLLLMIPLVLIACGGPPTEVAMEPTTAPTEPPPTEAPTDALPTEAAPTEAPTEPPPTEAPTEAPPTEAPTEPPPTEPPPTDTPEPTDEPAPEAVDDTACIACHTDEETLKALAVEPEASESLSEGEG